MKGMRLFDNYEEDGQLSLFSADYDDWDEEWEETSEESEEKAEETEKKEEKATDTKAKKDAETVPVAERKSKAGTIGAAVDTYEKAVAGLELTNAGPAVRVKYCASCGKLLFVKEETAGFHSECNNCGIKYFQKLS